MAERLVETIADELDGPPAERLAWAAGIVDAMAEAGFEVVDSLEVAVSGGG